MNKRNAVGVAVGLGVLLMGLLGLGTALMVAGAPAVAEPATGDDAAANVCRQYAPTPGPSPTVIATLTPPPPPRAGNLAAKPTPTRVRWRCAFIQPIFDLVPTPTSGPTNTPPPPP